MGFGSMFFEYETPKVITVKNVPMGILRAMIVMSTMSFLLYAQLYVGRGYQSFCDSESSVTTKVKGRTT